ncbi:glycosyltransferase [Paraburkholderia sp. MMS20-SJTR3]|uniref:Glycosyltransferase n=1 Tax=Paraburkholderia sejongensis TaxID=2886946 RepID=A0ABS8JPU6_9BURK|nr:glycosyltransferase [Paraburkholderia sp. MMS20-SJTR3]MCC8391857.1 glycosyltransferase [Paraburkholderia sp. MMS20-SJTR3]
MQRCRVLVINDFVEKGGAEVVYQQCAALLATLPGVEVERFDDSRFCARSTKLTRSWNTSAARALEKTLLRYRPHRIMVHNYHNLLSPSILAVLARHQRELRYLVYHTCHDYHLVYYNPSLQYFDRQGHPIILPLDALRTRAVFMLRPTPKGLVHDLMTKAWWHAIRAMYQPARVFDKIICPGEFMEEALHRCGIRNTVLVRNPSAVPDALPPVVVRDKQRFNIAFVGRISPEKGLLQFLQLAQATGFERIGCIGVYGDGPDRATIEQRYAQLIEQRKLILFGSMPQQQLFPAIREFADAIVVSSVGAENAPLVVIEGAMLGLPVLIRDGGAMANTAEGVGNKIKFHFDPASLTRALDELAVHLADDTRSYNVGDYRPAHYAQRLAEIMHIGEKPAPLVASGRPPRFANNPRPAP